MGFSDEQGAFEGTVEKPRPEPAEVLHVCKTQVAELELWLHQANVAFEPETLNWDMQQVVEQQLVGCQVRPVGRSSWLASSPITFQDWVIFLKQQCVSSCSSDYIYLGLHFLLSG